MKTKFKIQAFTLNEMIVVIILTSIIVGIAFSVLTIVNQHFNSIHNNLTFKTELNKLEEVLCIDFNRYQKIKTQKNQLILSHPLDSVTYVFNSKNIIRKTDTFNIATSKISFYFNGLKTNKTTIDAIKIVTDKETQNQTIFVYKKNDATPFINSWPLN